MDTNVAVLVDAKSEYTKQLIQVITPHLLSGLITIYDEAHNVCITNKEEDLTMLTFQELLGEVPVWNSVMVAEESERIINESKCDFLEDLLTAVFVCHTKILTTVRVTNKDRKINLNIPSVDNFVHQVYIEMAREFWKHPYLLNPSDVTKLEYQRNIQLVESKIVDSIETTIRKLLPVKNILKEYLAEDDAEETENADEVDLSTSDEMLATTSSKRKRNQTKSALDQSDSSQKLVGGGAKNESSTKSLHEKLQKDVTQFKEDKELSLVNDTSTHTDEKTKGGSSLANTFDSMLDAIVGRSTSPTTTGSNGASDVKNITLDKGMSASPVVPEPTTNSTAAVIPGCKEMSLNDLSLLTPTASDSKISPPAPAKDTTTTTGSSEISLDNLGSIEEVKVDYGQPSTTTKTAPVIPSVQTSVLSEFNNIASETKPSTPETTASPTPAPKSSYSFF
jgi:hypothetical protein